MTTGNNQELLSEKLNGELETISQQIETLRDKQVAAKLEGKPFEGASQIADLSAELEVVRRAHETAVAQEAEAERQQLIRIEISRKEDALKSLSNFELTRLKAVAKAETSTRELAEALAEMETISETITKTADAHWKRGSASHLRTYDSVNLRGRTSARIGRLLQRILPGHHHSYGQFSWMNEVPRFEEWKAEEYTIGNDELTSVRNGIEKQIDLLQTELNAAG